ncbi:MAG: 4-alpha-glucanotransferase [Elusimicrobiaceae bacterium]|nr:4-alpha-glucanotransferase [Elusimicrobiaceae bacterium]
MKLSFQINYKTVWGETLHAVLYRAHAAANENKINIPLSTQDGQTWKGHILLEFNQPIAMAYHYEVRNNGQTVRREWQLVPRILPVDPKAQNYILQDTWRDLPRESWLYSSAATDVFRKRTRKPGKTFTLFNRTLVMRVQAAQLTSQQSLYICGSSPELGNWNPQAAIPFTETEPNEWVVSFDAAKLPNRLEYKFFIQNKNSEKVLWEEGPNRTLAVPQLQDNDVYVLEGLRPHFKEAELLRLAGVVIPVFSLRREHGWGAGDFGDLKALTNWAVKTDQKVIQLLPVNDTNLTHTWQDSYPYNAVSVYALHPIYVNADALPPADKREAKAFEKEREKLNATAQLDYEAVLKLKLNCLQHAFNKEGKDALATTAFRRFFTANVHWLPTYAMFCVLRDKFDTAHFQDWPKYAQFSYEDLVQFCSPTSDDYTQVCFWYYVQFVLHTQLVEAAQYAREHGVILKGDIPIGISPNSVEAWTEPKLFHLNAQAGAPPDDFSATGQNWGFPTYNWDEMAKDGYRWWMRRFTHMSAYFDAYRIDHILGFFRIWQIPTHSVQGLLGQFSPALPFTETEIAKYGLTFKPEFVRPLITEEYLTEKLGDLVKKAKKKFLEEAENGTYQLREEFATQRQVESYFEGDMDEESLRLKEGLYALISNVLFVPDAQDPSKYHPRIAALKDGYFKTLSEADQKAFTSLYNDYFFHRHNEFWGEEALKKLPGLTQATRMLACAEDLGMIPACVKPVMEKLQLLSLEIQRMPKQLGAQFDDIKKYPYLSVATPSTHDMSVLRGWWKEEPARTQKFYNTVLGKQGKAPEEADIEICTQIIRLHYFSPSMLALIGLQDLTAMDETLRGANPDEERINIPANPRHYWRYRMPMTLETLTEATAFNDKLKEMINTSGR